MTLRLALAVCGALTALDGCSPAGPKCITGDSKSCACVGGLSGAQTCQSDGTYAACNCGTGGGSGGGSGSCVSDGGVPPKPLLMFLLDKSGSMNFPADPSAAGCPAGCGVTTGPCPAACPTRISELRTAMNTFLTSEATLAWTGMAIFPTKVGTDACGPSTAGDVVVQLAPSAGDLGSGLSAASAAVNTQVQSLVPGGGTPTADSIRFLSTYGPLAGNADCREKYVLLLTDGLPNCNATNPNTCMSGSPAGANCKCTLSACSSSFCTLGCLDKDNSATAISDLRRNNNVRTIVIGFGSDTVSGDALDTLNAMAQAGGVVRLCPNGTDAECGANNTCVVATSVCSRTYYQATSAAELSATLSSIANRIRNP